MIKMVQNNKKMKNKTRIRWIDYSKGIAILLVIYGHTIVDNSSNIERIIRGLIFSFHMPLFFIMSAMTYKFAVNRKSFINNTYKAFKHLVIPAVVIYGIRQLLFIVKHYNELQWGLYARSCVLSLFYCSGIDIIKNFQVPAFGMMWFLIVLFIGRTIFDLINMFCSKKIMALVSVMISIIGILISSKSWLPLSLDIALAIFPFLGIGLWLKEHNEKYIKGRFIYIFFIIWIGVFFIIYVAKNDYLELAARRYPLFPICYICAITGTLFVSCVAKFLTSFEKTKIIENIGKESIWVFAVHAMDYVYKPLWNITSITMLNGLIRIIEDVLVFIVIYRGYKVMYNWIKKIFNNSIML